MHENENAIEMEGREPKVSQELHENAQKVVFHEKNAQ
jgi:hypothetical protein